MPARLHVATRKGLFDLAAAGGGWDVVDSHFLGDPVTAVLNTADGLYAALDLGHFGAKLWRRDARGAWGELPVPVFPPKPAPEDGAAEPDPHPWTLGKIWVLEPGGRPGRLWAGTMPGGLFRSEDAGASWALMEALWRMPERRRWLGVAGGEQPGIHSVLVDPDDPADIRIGVSCAGVWASRDDGASWRIINQGMYAEYLPPVSRHEPIAQDVHRLARCAARPEIVWCQHHNGVFRSKDGGATWREVTAIRPAKFGFAVAAHPADPGTAWFVPAIKDERRIPVDGQLVVARTRDGGESFEVLRRGLPQRHAYDLVLRHALAVDGEGRCLAIGSTSGGLWLSEDGGDSWTMPDLRLPPIAALRFSDN